MGWSSSHLYWGFRTNTDHIRIAIASGDNQHGAYQYPSTFQ